MGALMVACLESEGETPVNSWGPLHVSLTYYVPPQGGDFSMKMKPVVLEGPE